MGDQAKQFYNVLESGTTTLTQALVESATTLENSAKNLRESQANWATLTDAEKRQIMEDNADLFGDKDFYNAFVNGQDITSYLQKANRDTIAFIQQEAAKLYRAAEAQGDYGTMQLLKQYLKAESEYLTLSLSDLVENENKQLDIIKDTLEKERDLLKENLKKRRDAYQDYYDKLNKMQEVQDYESERTKIVQQMTRLGGATDATSANKLLELQKQLTELDKEYRTTTVTNAQDAVLDGLDNQIDKLDEYYSDLLDNNQKMLEMYSDNYKALLIEQANLLALSGETSNSIANNLISFTRILGIDISDISLPELTGNTTTTTTTNNSYIFNGQVNSNVDSFMQEVFNAMKKYGLNLGGAK